MAADAAAALEPDAFRRTFRPLAGEETFTLDAYAVATLAQERTSA